jgi:hypothetical protein
MIGMKVSNSNNSRNLEATINTLHLFIIALRVKLEVNEKKKNKKTSKTSFLKNQIRHFEKKLSQLTDRQNFTISRRV